MATVVTVPELVSGEGKGKAIIGRVFGKSSKTVNGKPVVEMHLICGPTVDDVVFLDAWRGQAQRVDGVARENGTVIRIPGDDDISDDDDDDDDDDEEEDDDDRR